MELLGNHPQQPSTGSKAQVLIMTGPNQEIVLQFQKQALAAVLRIKLLHWIIQILRF